MLLSAIDSFGHNIINTSFCNTDLCGGVLLRRPALEQVTGIAKLNPRIGASLFSPGRDELQQYEEDGKEIQRRRLTSRWKLHFCLGGFMRHRLVLFIVYCNVFIFSSNWQRWGRNGCPIGGFETKTCHARKTHSIPSSRFRVLQCQFFLQFVFIFCFQ